jgi:uncharacterized membrane protein YdjX (TVP38/TMEM64 family)
MSSAHGAFGRIIKAMDAKAWVSFAASALLLLFVVFMFAFGRSFLNLEQDGQLEELVFAASQSAWAAPIVVAIFVALALTGFPQILLIAATVIVFGPGLGGFYAWLSTMISATFTFWLGWFYGGRFVARYGGEKVRATIDFIGRHGVAASALIRVVPTAPFIVVNAAAGAARIPVWKYWLGTGFGIIPKILLVIGLGAFGPGEGDLEDGVEGILAFFSSREPQDLALIALLAAGWAGLLLVARRAMKGMKKHDAAGAREPLATGAAAQNPDISSLADEKRPEQSARVDDLRTH